MSFYTIHIFLASLIHLQTLSRGIHCCSKAIHTKSRAAPWVTLQASKSPIANLLIPVKPLGLSLSAAAAEAAAVPAWVLTGATTILVPILPGVLCSMTTFCEEVISRETGTVPVGVLRSTLWALSCCCCACVKITCFNICWPCCDTIWIFCTWLFGFCPGWEIAGAGVPGFCWMSCLCGVFDCGNLVCARNNGSVFWLLGPKAK